jgi:hypothetical protein
MNTRILVSFILLLTLFAGCRKDKEERAQQEVEEFVSLLKSEKYKEMYLPKFTSDHIPALLNYRDDKRMVTNYPRNPVSSFYVPERPLGLICLWCIEAIRLKEKGENLVMGFPSLNCSLGYRDSEELSLVDLDDAFPYAAQAYNNWWNFRIVLRDRDPLEATPYKWN